MKFRLEKFLSSRFPLKNFRKVSKFKFSGYYMVNKNDARKSANIPAYFTGENKNDARQVEAEFGNFIFTAKFQPGK